MKKKQLMITLLTLLISWGLWGTVPDRAFALSGTDDHIASSVAEDPADEVVSGEEEEKDSPELYDEENSDDINSEESEEEIVPEEIDTTEEIPEEDPVEQSPEEG